MEVLGTKWGKRWCNVDPNELVFISGVLTSVPILVKIDQGVTPLWLVFHCTYARRLSWPGWLVTYQKSEIIIPHRKVNPDTVTHPSTNRARCQLTFLIETNALPLRQTTTPGVFLLKVAKVLMLKQKLGLSQTLSSKMYDRTRQSVNHSVILSGFKCHSSLPCLTAL